jgi:hypothetical protein
MAANMRASQLKPEFVEYIPDRLVPGTLYISDRYRTCSHLCCCGCGEEVVTPLSPAEWSITRYGERVSLWPSVGNWDYACRSHYVIDKNSVRWARPMNSTQINAVKRRDALDLSRMIRSRNENLNSRSRTAGPWWKRSLRWMFGWL